MYIELDPNKTRTLSNGVNVKGLGIGLIGVDDAEDDAIKTTIISIASPGIKARS